MKARIVTRADLQAHYPGCKLQQRYWQSTEDPEVGWMEEREFRPTHLLHFHAYGAGQLPTKIDFVMVEPGLNKDRYQEVFTPLDFEKELQIPNSEELKFLPSYLFDSKTGKWWHAKNEHPSWVRGRVKHVEPVTYMRELPPELCVPEQVWGFVYFVTAGEGGPIKIGWSQDVARRMEELQTANPHNLVLVGKIRGTRADEARVHRLFAKHQIQSEWFRHDPEILAFIRSLEADGRTAIAVCQ